MRVAFWVLAALDALGILTLFLLGLAAAGSTRSSPLQVALLLLVLPGTLLAAAISLFLRATTPAMRLLALLLAAAPLLVAVSARAIAEVQLRANTNERGDMTFFRSGPKRELAEAIARNDAGAVAALARQVDVNDAGFDGVTPLLLAARQLRRTPERVEVVRALLAAGADPNVGAQYEYPLALAIQTSGKSGPEPVKLMLDAGADPDLKTSYGVPVWFDATGQSASLETLAMLIDRGADVNAVGPNGQTALFSAAATRNWKAAQLLLERGADPTLGRSVNGQSFRSLVDAEAGSEGGDGAYAAVSRRVQQR